MFIGERDVEVVLELNSMLIVAVKQFNLANPPAHIDSVPSGGIGKSPRIPRKYTLRNICGCILCLSVTS